MSLRLIFLALLLSQSAIGGTKACGGAKVGFWTNPDGSRGGMVASTAKAFTGAYIAPEAQVCDYAQIQSGAKLLDRATLAGRAQLLAGGEVGGSARVEGEAKVGGSANIPTRISGEVVVSGSPLITGRTNISQKAKVSGSAKIHNSIICQASLIEGIEVIESDYYCQTDDPEPPHPGEAGTKTLLGVDVDRDGVRDDIEIWINQKFSNTAEKDFYNERNAFKQLIKSYQKKLLNKNIPGKYKEAVAESLDVDQCLNPEQDKSKMTRAEKKEYLNKKMDRDLEIRSLSQELDAEFYNTPERMRTEIESRKMSHGLTLSPALKTKDGCDFKKRVK